MSTNTKPHAATAFPKLIYFAERAPGLDPGSFIRRWRQHAALGMSMARWERNIERYVHCDPAAVDGVTSGGPFCDGVAMVWYLSEDARLRHAADPAARAIMKRDELKTFARPVREFAVLTEERVIREGADASLKLFARVRRDPAEDRQAFGNRWLDEFSPRLCERLDGLGAPAGYVQNHARRGDGPGADEPLCDCAYRAALADAGAVRDVEMVWTTETLLYSR